MRSSGVHRSTIKAGEGHYDTISAFIKSVRGSSPDGALYWLARMLESGEDPLFIARRLVILASEDIGLAEPQALPVAVAAQQAVHFLGLPEGRIPLAEATVYLATAPKSNTAYMALERALGDVRKRPNDPVPLHLRNAVTGMMRAMDYGKGYRYAHDHPGHFVEQQYLPDSVRDARYYFPSSEGKEREIDERLRGWWEEGGSGSGGKGLNHISRLNYVRLPGEDALGQKVMDFRVLVGAAVLNNYQAEVGV